MKKNPDSVYQVWDPYQNHTAPGANPLQKENFDDLEVFPGGIYKDPLKINPLTNREMEILKLLGEGHTAQKIADQLSISIETVRSHRKKMLTKAEGKNTTALVAYCIRKGYI